MAVSVGCQTTSVWLNSSQCGNGGKVCYLRLPCWF